MTINVYVCGGFEDVLTGWVLHKQRPISYPLDRFQTRFAWGEFNTGLYLNPSQYHF